MQEQQIKHVWREGGRYWRNDQTPNRYHTREEAEMALTTIQEAANEGYASRFDGEMHGKIAWAEYGNEEHSEEAREQLQEMPLSIEKLITDHRNETTTWEILLGTGGPADRVLVTFDQVLNRVLKAEYQFQDWFQPWTTAENQDEELVKRFAEIVGYYEERD